MYGFTHVFHWGGGGRIDVTLTQEVFEDEVRNLTPLFILVPNRRY